MAIVGTVDPWTPPDDVAAAEAAGVTVVRYEGADHGFVHDASRPAHRADDAADAWQRAIAFLSRPVTSCDRWRYRARRSSCSRSRIV